MNLDAITCHSLLCFHSTFQKMGYYSSRMFTFIDFQTSLTSYLSALDFWHSLVGKIKFNQLDFFPILSWIFAGYTGSKNPVQTRKKIQFIKLEILINKECQKSSADRQKVRLVTLALINPQMRTCYCLLMRNKMSLTHNIWEIQESFTYLLKMEYVSKYNIFGLNMMVSLHAKKMVLFC